MIEQFSASWQQSSGWNFYDVFSICDVSGRLTVHTVDPGMLKVKCFLPTFSDSHSRHFELVDIAFMSSVPQGHHGVPELSPHVRNMVGEAAEVGFDGEHALPTPTPIFPLTRPPIFP